jgi:hypothetical protein
MAGNKLFATRRQFALCNMQVSSANTTGTHMQQDVSRHKFRTGNLGDPKRVLRDVLRGSQDSGFHANTRLEPRLNEFDGLSLGCERPENE